MAKVASGEETSARVACATLSRKHTSGEKRTPFSRCVVVAKKLADQPARDSSTINPRRPALADPRRDVVVIPGAAQMEEAHFRDELLPARVVEQRRDDLGAARW
jgi:hypothetical protein